MMVKQERDRNLHPPGRKMPVFICYRRVDGLNAARRVHQLLHGWRTTENGADIEIDAFLDVEVPGVGDWRLVHGPYLQRAGAFIVICTPGCKLHEGPDDWVHKEIDEWLQSQPETAPILVDPIGQGRRFVPSAIVEKWPNIKWVVLPEGLDPTGRPDTSPEHDTIRREIIGAVLESGARVYEQELQVERRRSRLLRVAMFALSAALLIAIWMAVHAHIASDEALDRLAVGQALQASLAAMQPGKEVLSAELALESAMYFERAGRPLPDAVAMALANALSTLRRSSSFAVPGLGPITGALVTNDGTMAIVARAGGRCYVFDEETRRASPLGPGTKVLCLSPDGLHVAASAGEFVYIYNLHSRRTFAKLPARDVRCGAFCSNGVLLVTLSSSTDIAENTQGKAACLRVWDTRLLRQVVEHADERLSLFSSCWFSNGDDRIIATSVFDETVCVWPWRDNKPIEWRQVGRVVAAGPQGEHDLLVLKSPDSFGFDDTVTYSVRRLDEPASAVELLDFSATDRGLEYGIAIARRGMHIVGSDSIRAGVWDASTGERVSSIGPLKSQLDGWSRTVRGAVSLGLDGSRGLISAGGNTAWLFDLDSGEVLASLEGHNSQIAGAAVSANGLRAVTWTARDECRWWSLDGDSSVARLRLDFAGDEWVSSAGTRFLGYSDTLVIGTRDGRTISWDTTTGRRIESQATHDWTTLYAGGRVGNYMLQRNARFEYRIVPTCANSGGEHNLPGVFVTAALDVGRACVTMGGALEIVGGSVQHSIPIPEGVVGTSAVFAPNGEWLCVAHELDRDTRLLQLWSLGAAPRLVAETSAHVATGAATPDWCWALAPFAVSNDGSLVALRGDSGIGAWWPALGRVWTERVESASRDSVMISDDMESIAVTQRSPGDEVGGVELYSVSRRSRIQVIEFAAGGVSDVVLSPNGGCLATLRGTDGRITIWNVQTGAAISEFSSSHWALASLRFSPDGVQLACANDEAVSVFDATSRGMLRQLCRLAVQQSSIRSNAELLEWCRSQLE